MAHIKIDKEKCKSCMLCVSVCPKNLIQAGNSLNQKGVKAIEFGSGECTACCFCAIICPDAVIEVYK